MHENAKENKVTFVTKKNSRIDEKLQNLTCKSQTSETGETLKSQGIKRSPTLLKLKHSNSNSLLNKTFQLKKSKKSHKSMNLIEKKPNIRDFNLMVDTEKVYCGFSQDNVLENRIISLMQQRKQQELEAISSQKFKIELKSTSFKSFSREIIEQIKENRKKIQALPSSKKQNFRVALKSNWIFQDNRSRPPTIILRRHFMRQGSFLKGSPKSPKKGALSKKKKVALKMDDELEFKYESISQKINEPLIVKNEKEEAIEMEEEDYLEIHRQDSKIQMKCQKVWSGSEVLPMKIFHGYWSLDHINSIFQALSYSKMDRIIWLKPLKGKVKFYILF